MASAPKPLEKIPDHLQPFVARQDPNLYTPIDHAAWRYIMRLSRSFLGKHAHAKYLDGLRETGISQDRIPLIEEMDACLRRFGWRAVGVVGFIPPAAFMEFQSLGVLPIACDMRALEHIDYTPAPDIVHEAAGHAPMLADPDYAAYLRAYGEVSRRAIASDRDMEVYQAIRELSDIKENPKATPGDIEAAQKRLNDAISNNSYISESTYLARMNWWTVEYGLVGSIEKPLIYGAGLLSSVGESSQYLSESVAKIPLTLDCLNMSYDITRPQPQLYVVREFTELRGLLEEIAETMAFRKGGTEGLAKARIARSVNTIELESGIQISGLLKSVRLDASGVPSYLQFGGPTQLSRGDIEIEGQGPKAHWEGFGTPVGLVRDTLKSASALTDEDLRARGFEKGRKGRIELASGVVVEGKLESSLGNEGAFLVLTFTDCTVRDESAGGELLFRPEWGRFDMACGAAVVSVSGGAADRGSYLRATGGFRQAPASQKTNHTAESAELEELYQTVRQVRDQKGHLGVGGSSAAELSRIRQMLDAKYPDDWLLRMELLELESDVRKAGRPAPPWSESLRAQVAAIQARVDASKADVIRRGLELL